MIEPVERIKAPTYLWAVTGIALFGTAAVLAFSEIHADLQRIETAASHPPVLRCVLDSAGEAQIAEAIMTAQMATNPVKED